MEEEVEEKCEGNGMQTGPRIKGLDLKMIKTDSVERRKNDNNKVEEEDEEREGRQKKPEEEKDEEPGHNCFILIVCDYPFLFFPLLPGPFLFLFFYSVPIPSLLTTSFPFLFLPDRGILDARKYPLTGEMEEEEEVGGGGVRGGKEKEERMSKAEYEKIKRTTLKVYLTLL